MATLSFFILVFLTALVGCIKGHDLRGMRQEFPQNLPEDCMSPPTIKQGPECCILPKERIWGDLRQSLRICLKKIKDVPKPLRLEMADDVPEMATPEGSDMFTPTELPIEFASIPNTSPYYTTPGYFNHRGRPHKKKTLSERFKELFSTVYKEIKNTFSAIWQSVVIITDQLHRHSNDSCFMECVFEEQGFLINKMVSKAKLLGRLSKTLGNNAPWHEVAVAAVEKCYQTEMSTPINKTCNSGSEEIFRCIFRQIFFNCPNWAQSDYCMSLKEFYQKCQNDPLPETTDNQTSPPPPDDLESSPSTESNPSSESEVTPAE